MKYVILAIHHSDGHYVDQDQVLGLKGNFYEFKEAITEQGFKAGYFHPEGDPRTFYFHAVKLAKIV